MLSNTEIITRILCAFAAGIILGLERETHGRPAGLRTTVLTCVAAALAMILSHEFALIYNRAGDTIIRSDPGRLAAGVLSGIGFLGAGTIFRSGSLVRGVTTAAVLWFSTVLGLVFGSGQWLIGLFGLIVAIVTLIILPLVDERIPHNAYTRVTVATTDEQADTTSLREVLEKCGVRISDISFLHDFENNRRETTFDIQFEKDALTELSHRLSREIEALPGVLQVRWENRSNGP